MMMIPGAWERRSRSNGFLTVVEGVAVVEPHASPPSQPAPGAAGNKTGPDTERPEFPAWLRVSIFAGTLLIAMGLAMIAFF